MTSEEFRLKININVNILGSTEQMPTRTMTFSTQESASHVPTRLLRVPSIKQPYSPQF